MQPDAYDQLIADAARRCRMVWNAAIARAGAARAKAPGYAFALQEGHYPVCAHCGAWGGALELSGQCDHPASLRTHRACWTVVTATGESVPLTPTLLAELQPDAPRGAGSIRAAGVVVCTLDAALNHVGSEPVTLLEEGLIIGISQELLRLAPSARTIIL